jgi:hypothetical protein
MYEEGVILCQNKFDSLLSDFYFILFIYLMSKQTSFKPANSRLARSQFKPQDHERPGVSP